jgi:CheY-like chemotaxis protein
MSRRVLVVEDDVDIGRLVCLQLAELGCDTRLIDDGVTALNEARERRYDLVVLDLMLPRLDGLEICRRLRQGNDPTPILMLTAKSSEIDRVLGLELGADDYLTKPFSMPEFAARVKGVFRRAERTAAQASAAAAATEAQKASAKVGRCFRRLHAHGLIAKIPRTRRWRVTDYGRKVMGTTMYLREHHFPNVYAGVMHRSSLQETKNSQQKNLSSQLRPMRRSHQGAVRSSYSQPAAAKRRDPGQDSPRISLPAYSSIVISPPSASALPWSDAGRCSCTKSMRFQDGIGVSQPALGTYFESSTLTRLCT